MRSGDIHHARNASRKCGMQAGGAQNKDATCLPAGR